MSDETINWKYSKCLYCKKDVDPHHDCQIVKQCKKRRNEILFSQIVYEKVQKKSKKIKKICIFLIRVNFLPYNREEETSLVSW